LQSASHSQREISIFNCLFPDQPITGDCQHPIAGGCTATYRHPRQYEVIFLEMGVGPTPSLGK